VQQVQIEVIGAQAAEAVLAGVDGALAAGVAGQHLADEEDLVAAAGQGLAEQGLDAAVAVELGGVDVGGACIEGGPHGGDGLGAGGFFELPGAVADDRDGAVGDWGLSHCLCSPAGAGRLGGLGVGGDGVGALLIT
jgi:hypothetical protein